MKNPRHVHQLLEPPEAAAVFCSHLQRSLTPRSFSEEQQTHKVTHTFLTSLTTITSLFVSFFCHSLLLHERCVFSLVEIILMRWWCVFCCLKTSSADWNVPFRCLCVMWSEMRQMHLQDSTCWSVRMIEAPTDKLSGLWRFLLISNLRFWTVVTSCCLTWGQHAQKHVFIPTREKRSHYTDFTHHMIRSSHWSSSDRDVSLDWGFHVRRFYLDH